MKRLIPLLVLLFLVTACQTQASTPTETTTEAPPPTETPAPEPTSTKEPFDSEYIEFMSADGVILVGRLDLPEGQGPFPAAVFVHGSGPGPRNQAQSLADQLLANGMAVFRYDKRGMGDSEGIFREVGVSNGEERVALLASDAIAAVELLQTFEEISPVQIGLMGNSQAGWVIPQAIAMSEEVAFGVILVGPAVSVGEEIFYSGLTREDPERLTDEFLAEVSVELAEFDRERGYDPREAIEAIDIPVLWVLGGRDASIPTAETVIILEDIQAQLNKDFTVHVYPLGTHGLSNVETGEAFPFMAEVVMPWLENVLMQP